MTNETSNNLNHYKEQHAELILSSFSRLTGRDLISPTLSEIERYKALYEAGFCVVSHDTQTDPVFNYANKTAQALFEMEWDEFTQLPSRFSAEEQVREERERLLFQVEKYGFIDDYQGIRVSSSGKKFFVENAIVWNLVDEHGRYCGQAAVLYEWSSI